MTSYRITGRKPLVGCLKVQGSKNAALPIIAASLLNKGITELYGCPDILDVRYMLQVLMSIGCQVSWDEEMLKIDSSDIQVDSLSTECIGKMRSSILLLGALLGRCQNLELDYPGGCTIGARPVDIHLSALRQMGVHIEETTEKISCAWGKLKGADITLPYPSVGATENLMMAGVVAEGITWIRNAAREPEVIDLAKFLGSMGVSVYGAGTSRIGVIGGTVLHKTGYTVMPDRIVAGTYLLGAAGTGGQLELLNVSVNDLQALLHVCEVMGCMVHLTEKGIYLEASKNLFSVDTVHTRPFPGFPTDLQSPLMSVLTTAAGKSVIYEHIFENRFKTVGELKKMGADITIENNIAMIHGVNMLRGCRLFAKDLRGGAALVVAGLMAEGDTIVENTIFVERGYENICKDLTLLGADIRLERK